MEHHALDGHLRFEHFQQVPRDGFTLAVLISGQVELVSILKGALEFSDTLFLLRRHLIVRSKAVFDVDGETTVRALLHGHGQFGRLRQVADMTDRGFNTKVRP